MNKTVTVLNASLKILFTLLICLVTFQGWSQQNLYVDSAATGANNGSSWTDAYTKLTDALGVAASGGVPARIYVARGTYYPTGDQAGTSRDEAFTIVRDNIKLYGGYPTGGGARDIANNPVYLDGNIGDAAVYTDNSYHVMVVAGIVATDSVVVDGFSFRNGQADTLSIKAFNGVIVWNYNGGALVIQNNTNGQNMRILNCSFDNNRASTYGGAVIASRSAVVLENCEFTNNLCNEDIGLGGAILNDYSIITVSNCSFISNNSKRGGAIANDYYASSFVTGSRFDANSSIIGGAIHNQKSCSFTITNSQFSNNSATTAGGALFQEGGTVAISSSQFIANSAPYGGAIRNEYTPILSVKNSLFSKNTSINTGAAMSLSLGSDTLVGNLFIQNKDNSAVGGGAICLYGGNFSVVNNTFYADTTTNGRGGAIRLEGSIGTAKLQNNVFYKCQAVSGNDVYIDAGMAYSERNNSFSIDPGFVNEASPIGADNQWNTADDGLALNLSSAAANGGNVTGFENSLPATDLAGNARIINGIIDMGAYESAADVPHVLYVDSTNGSDNNNGGSWVFTHKTLARALTTAHLAGSAVDSILVAKGTYYPTGSQASTARDSAFTIQRGNIKLYGGYPAGGGARDIVNNPVYLDGNINDAAIDTDNSYHVMVIAGLAASQDSAIIDGVTFRNGNANTSAIKTYNAVGVSQNAGGALVLQENLNGKKIRLLDCSFVGNESRTTGGAVIALQSDARFERCLFNYNIATTSGGAVFQDGGSILITGSSFMQNNAQYGGAIRNQGNPILSVKNSIFSGNTSTNTGAAMSLSEGSDTLVSNLFVRNKDNSAVGGGALCITTGRFSIVNNTFYADTTTGGGGGAIRLEGSTGSANLRNNIFYKCKAATGDNVYNQLGMPYSQSNNSFSIDPAFVGEASPIGTDNTWGTADDGLVLGSSSPVANGGNTTGINNSLPPTDLAGNPRIISGTIDMGAYESMVAAPHVLHVDSTYGNDGNSGGSWVFPHKTLAQALTVAHTSGSTVDSILVAKGTYFPTGTQSGTDRDSAFTLLRAGIKLYGGYPAGGGARDLVANRVYLDGNINNPADSTDNSYHVLLIVEARNGADSVVMDGFTIRNGNASKVSEGKLYKGIYVPRYTGGGGYIVFNAPFNLMRFSNCNVTYNTAILEGGGLYNINSSPVMEHCSFIGNKAGTDGGGLYNRTASPLMDSCTLAGNMAHNGAGMYNTNTSSPIVRNSRFIGNIAAGFGGGMDSWDNSNPALEGNEFAGNKARSGGAIYGLYATTPITRCRFEGNEATEGGGALFHSGGLFMINRSVFIGNSAQYGGAIRNDQINTLSVKNSVFVSNTSTNTGAALSLYQGSDTLVGNAFIRNKDYSTAGGGAICAANGNFHIINNTFYADSSTNGRGGAIRLETPFGYCNLYNNIFYKCYAGAADNEVHNANGLPLNQSHNSYTIDPRFVGENDLDGEDDTWGTLDDGLSLDFCSPVINVGNDALVPAGNEIDIANRFRPLFSSVDLGAYEAASAFSLNEDSPTMTANGTCNIDGWVNYFVYSDPNLLLSIKPGTNNLGTVTAASHLRTGYGTNNTAVLTTPFGNTNNLHPFNRSWTITTTNSPADSVGVRFYFGTRDSSDVRGAVPFNRLRDLVLYKVDGADAWDPAATGYVEYKYADAASKTTYTLGTYQALRYAEFYVTSFSSGSMASLPLGALPLDLLSFTGRLVNDKTKLQWLTSSEVNVAHFEVERSTNNDWVKIGQVVARNRTGNQQYELWDNNPASGTNHYRLKMVDIDGDFKYSKVVTVSTNGATVHVYPNPNNGQFAVEINNAGRTASLQLFDASGKSVHRQRLVQGINQVNVKWLSGGIYVLKIEDEWNSHVERLIINK